MAGIGQLAEELRRRLAEVEPRLYSGNDCAALAEQLARTEKACAAARVRFSARAVEYGEHARYGYADAASWVAATAGSSLGEARQSLDVVQKVGECPATQDALLGGEVSLEQAHAIVTAPGHEGELLELAKRSGSAAVQRRARKRRLADMDSAELHQAQHQAREFVHWRDELNMVCFRGALPPEIGIPLVNRIDRETDRLWRQARKESRRERSVTLAADAFTAMLPGTADGTHTEKGANPRSRTRKPAWRADVVFAIDLRAYLRGHAHPGEVCQIAGGGPVPVSIVRAHIADAFVKAVVHDGTRVDTIAHYGRRRPALLQSVLDLGDPPDFDGIECVEEGCERRYGLEWDHDDPVANGGPTSRQNLAPRCWPHHREKTARDHAAGKLRGRQPDEQERGP